MKLTLKIKLLPSISQQQSLLETLKIANAACNAISITAWDSQIFNQYKLHQLCYHFIKQQFNLSAQIVVRAIAKVADSYKAGDELQRKFKSLGSIPYDTRILSYKTDTISIWTTTGREKIPFVCHRPDWIPYIKGESDLFYSKGKFFLLQTVEVPEEITQDIEQFLGVDFGVVDIVALSTGETVSSKWINQYRLKRAKIRSSIQRKGTRSSRKLLKRLSNRERATATLINHTISKRIVEKAKTAHLGIAIENLKGIRKAVKVRKHQRGLRHSWSFDQLRQFLEYKAKLHGVKLVAVNPAYTSQLCSACGVIAKRKGKIFTCKACGNLMDADINAAINIATRGHAVTHVKKSINIDIK